MICPFCKYERKKEDHNPDWECPNCNKAYNKYKPESNHKNKNAPDSLIKRWLGVILGLGLSLWGISDFIMYGTLKICGQGGNCSDLDPMESPLGFIFMAWVFLTVGYYSIVTGIKLLKGK